MRVAVILINKNDDGIERTVESLVELPMVAAREAEIIVVDASAGRFEHVRRRFPDVRWIDFPPLEGRSSIPHQRNLGLRATEAETMVFIDASCVPGPGWLERLCRPIWEEGETVVAGSHRSSGSSRFRNLAVERLEGQRYLTEAATINLAVRRSALRAISGFDESFRYGSDVDLTWRLLDAGHSIRYVPDAFVSHDWGGVREEVRRSYAYGRARGRLYLKHRGRWRGLFGADSPVLVYPLLLTATPLFLRRPRLLAILVVPLVRNRGRRPLITLAEHLVYACGALRALADAASDRAGRPGNRRSQAVDTVEGS
jgi:GT2 family glycosyltransferase